MKLLIVSIFVFLLAACEQEPQAVDDNYLKAAIEDGRLVNVEDDGLVSINGAIVGHYNVVPVEKKLGLTTGCFSIPECVRMDDSKGRAVVKISVDDFSFYAEDGSEQYPDDVTGVTYFMSTFYFPFGASNANRNQLRNAIQNEVGNWSGHGDKHGKRLGWCQEKNPHTCFDDEGDH